MKDHIPKKFQISVLVISAALVGQIETAAAKVSIVNCPIVTSPGHETFGSETATVQFNFGEKMPTLETLYKDERTSTQKIIAAVFPNSAVKIIKDIFHPSSGGSCVYSVPGLDENEEGIQVDCKKNNSVGEATLRVRFTRLFNSVSRNGFIHVERTDGNVGSPKVIEYAFEKCTISENDPSKVIE